MVGLLALPAQLPPLRAGLAERKSIVCVAPPLLVRPAGRNSGSIGLAVVPTWSPVCAANPALVPSPLRL
jgi:hypothetical protein